MTQTQKFSFPIDEEQSVSALLCRPADATACYVFAHGAGAGMDHPFMNGVADGLARRRIATLRYQFPYMERSSKRVDRPPVAYRAVRAAVAKALVLCPGLPVFAGGKSFGGRMTSGAQAEGPMPSLRGIAFVGFPLHLADKPAVNRAQHLAEVKVPMLFLQGSRDALADIDLMRSVVVGLGDRATLHEIEAADHSFRVLVRSGRTDDQVMNELLDKLAAWISQLT